jgi:hypothetical protein
MKISIKQSLLSLLLIVSLSGCGSSGGGTDGSMMSVSGGGGGDMGSLMGGGDISMLSGMGGDGSLGGDMGGLMGGGGLDMSLLFGDGGGDGGGSTSSTPPPPNFKDEGDVFISYQGKEIFFKSVAMQDDSVYPSAYQEKVDFNTTDGKSYTMRIAGYDTHGNRVHLESGFLVFTFTMPTPTLPGWYDLETPANSSGKVRVTYAQLSDDNSSLHLKGKLMDAEIYNMEQNATYNIDVNFDVNLLQAAPLQQ